MPKFSVRGIWKRWRESHPKDETKLDDAITVFTGVPTMYTRLIQGYDAMDPDLQAASATAGSQLRVEHLAISECCVSGLLDNTYGEAATAIIVPDMEIKKAREKDLKPAITLDELSSWAKQKLAPYKAKVIHI
ncbi:hypothetical protein Lser_V15G45681 [Lactuca serriola]